MPTRGQITYETHLALNANLRDVKHVVAMVGRKSVVDARNLLAKTAVEARKNNPFAFVPREVFVLWIDDDAWWPPVCASVMVNALRETPGLDVLFGWFGKRMPYSTPCAWREASNPDSFPKPGQDCAPGTIVPIERAGFHFAMMRLSVLERLGDDPFSIDSAATSEDFAFCDRAIAAGFKLGVGTGVAIAHLDATDGSAYLPGMPAMMADGQNLRALSLEHTVGEKAKTGAIRQYGLGAVEVTEEQDRALAESLRNDLRERREISVR